MTLASFVDPQSQDADDLRAIIAPRPFGTFACLGDSRMAIQFADGGATRYSKNSTHWLNHASALLGQRLRTLYNGAVSGNRSDQYLGTIEGNGKSKLENALLSGARHLIIWGVVNDITQGYTDTQAWEGYNGSPGIKSALDQAIRRGMHPVVVTEPGKGSGWSSTQNSYLWRYNQRLREYCEANPNCILFDLARVVWDANASSLAFKTNYYNADLLHPQSYGGYFIGKEFKRLYEGLFPFFQRQPSAAFEVNQAFSANNLFNNGLFSTGTGGTPGTGNTGTLPSGVTGSRTGAAAAAFSVEASADGIGNVIVADITFAAAGERVILNMTPNVATVGVGDMIEAGCEVAVDAGSVNFDGPYLRLSVNGNGFAVEDMYRTGSVSGPAEAYAQILQTPVATILASPAFTNLSYNIILMGAGAGSAKVRVGKAFARKRIG